MRSYVYSNKYITYTCNKYNIYIYITIRKNEKIIEIILNKRYYKLKTNNCGAISCETHVFKC